VRRSERFWENLSAETGADYQPVCGHYTVGRSATLADPDVTRRMIFNHELGLRFFNGEGHTFDLLEDLNHIECRILLLTGEDDPLPQLKMPPISRAAFLPVRASPMLAMACSAMTGNAVRSHPRVRRQLSLSLCQRRHLFD
jgi:pimeloyl-ACP methyl ester carboxylesterase